jgi:ABC-type multidrug transport system ATPase subunit
MSAYLKFSNLTKDYGAVHALTNVSLSIQRGSILAVLGPNGAGKSTLFGCLLGLTWPTCGEILLQGRRVTDDNRGQFGYVAERVALYPHRTVAENAVFFALLKGSTVAEADAQIDRVGLRAVRDRKVRQLSKGMLQRVGLAIGLCGRPELLILDEPFNGLDPAVLDTLQAILLEEHQRGATVLVSTHTISAIEPLATHVAILFGGHLVANSTVEGLRADFNPTDSLEQIYQQIARRHCRANAHQIEVVA